MSVFDDNNIVPFIKWLAIAIICITTVGQMKSCSETNNQTIEATRQAAIEKGFTAIEIRCMTGENSNAANPDPACIALAIANSKP